MENMDYMDIDEVCDIPDTPDRLAAHMINGKGCIEMESESSVASQLGNNDSFGKEAINKLRGRSKLVLGNGDSRKLSFQSGKYPGVSNKSEGDGNFPISLDNSLFSNHENRYSLYSQHIEKGKALYSSQSPTCGENFLEDLTEQSGPAQVDQNPFPTEALDDRQTNEIRKGPIPTNGFSFLRGISNSSTTTNNACKGKGKIDNTCKGGSGLDSEKGAFGDSQPKARKVTSSSFYSLPSPRVGGQKRLVRNGFICPHRIAKANQLAENRRNGPTDVQHDKETLVSDCSLSPIRDLIAEDNGFLEGQKVVTHTSSSKEPGTRTIDLATRSSITHNEEASRDAFRCFEGLGGRRSTRTRSKKITLPLADEGLHLSRTKDDPCFVNQKNANKVVRRDSGNGSSSSVGSKTASTSTLIKRQKQGSASSSYGESSTSASAGSDIMFLSPSRELLKSRSTRNQSGHGPTVLDPVIEIDEFSPEARHIGSHNIGSSSNADSDAMARQIQADEMLARELQEQLYNEAPGPEDDEIDAHTQSAVQQEEISQNAHSSGSHPIFHPRGSLISSFYRRLQSCPPQNPSIHRGTNPRGPSSRLTRLRSCIPSQLSRLPFRESSSLFPPNMDLDMRVHILEALEAFSEMGMAGNFLEAEREFNENDYEMLLALDENNRQHGGASLDQINRLPQSTVQGDNFEEACAICLETPTSGDTIRHLPCLHKFHKDCIDPWLRRRTSCPICKSSIT